MRKIFFVIAIFALISSCQKSIPEEQIEENNHQYCLALGLDFGDDNPIKTEAYWRCRLILKSKKIKKNKVNINWLRHDKKLQNHVENFDNAFEKKNDYLNNFINKNHHEICTRMGYDIDSLEQDLVEKYLQCQSFNSTMECKSAFSQNQIFKSATRQL